MKHQISVLDATQYREYNNIYLITKYSRSKLELMMSISESKLEIYPKQTQLLSPNIFWKKSRGPASYNIDGVVDCEIVEKKQNGKWIFR